MIRDLYRTLSEAAKDKPKSKDKPKAKPTPREEPILNVKLVDGKKTRDTIAVDFIGGGHHFVYPDLIPKDEVWIEQDLAPDEQTDILVHELIEYALMKQGMTYTPAHNLANKLEKVFRGFEGRWKTKQAPGADKVEESLLVESYNRALPAFIKYLNGGTDPYDFAHLLSDFFEDEGITPPDEFDESEPYEFLDRGEFEQHKDRFIAWLGDRLANDPDLSDAHAPTYLFLSGAKLVPRQTWLIHFSDDADDIARDGFRFGAEDFTALGLTTHFSEKVRKKRPGWNFAFKADDRDVKNASKKYGKQAVLFQSAGVEAYHAGDNEDQVVFWGPNVKERFWLMNDGGDWVVKNPSTDKDLFRSENIFDAINWVKANHDQYRKVITNAQVSKPIQPTPKADREQLQAVKPEKTPQPFEAVNEEEPAAPVPAASTDPAAPKPPPPPIVPFKLQDGTEGEARLMRPGFRKVCIKAGPEDKDVDADGMCCVGVVWLSNKTWSYRGSGQFGYRYEGNAPDRINAIARAIRAYRRGLEDEKKANEERKKQREEEERKQAEAKKAREEPLPQHKNPQVNSPEFKAWFEGSLAVDKKGQPKRMYRGTRSDMNKSFRGSLSFTDDPDIASVYSNDPEANWMERGHDGRVTPVFLSLKNPVMLDKKTMVSMEDLKKAMPGMTDDDVKTISKELSGYAHMHKTANRGGVHYVDVYAIVDTKAFTSIAKRLGYDGVIHKDVFTAGKEASQRLIDKPGEHLRLGRGDTHLTYRVFSMNQVKSAIGNKGTFDPKSDNIGESMGDKGVCPKCGLQKHSVIPHLCPKGRSKWGMKGGKFTTPERRLYKVKVDEGETSLLAIVKNVVSNEHPDDHVPEDYTWAREKAFNPQSLIHMMPGGLAGWKSWLKDECRMVPGQWDKLAKTDKIEDPVVVSPGHIWDGWHRIAAAIVNGIKTIPAIVGTHAR